jgi:hypothetical protein
MAALAADRVTRSKSIGRGFTGDVAATKIIYKGALVAKNATGYIVPAADTAGLVVVGVAMAYVDNSAGADGAKKVNIQTGVFEFDNEGGAIVQASKHALCYVAFDNSVTTAAVAANDIKAGTVDDFTTTKVWVRIAPE